MPASTPLRLDFSADPPPAELLASEGPGRDRRPPVEGQPCAPETSPHPGSSPGTDAGTLSEATPGLRRPGPAQQFTSSLLGETDTDLPPTWSEHSPIFHTTEKCTRLQSIRRNRRITGNPGLRQHCLNCLDITATKRRG